MTTPRHTVRLRGRFVFASHREFNDAVDAALKTSEPNVIIDLSDTVYIDSAALGMLLLARHRAEQQGKRSRSKERRAPCCRCCRSLTSTDSLR